MNQIRSSGFWLTRFNSLVRCIILKCPRWKQLGAKLQQPKMADLLKKRMSEEPAFMYCGACLGHFSCRIIGRNLKDVVLCILSGKQGHKH